MPGLEDVLGYQLARASITTHGVFAREVGGPLELRPVEYTILALIGESPGMSLARLAQLLAVTAPNITVWINHLEKRGLVTRLPSTTDRRAQVLQLTPEGRRGMADATKRLVRAEHAALPNLSRGEFILLIELLQKVNAARSP